MSEALKEARKRKVTHEQAREAWKKLHDALYNQGRVPTLSVPPQPEDVDIVLTDYISQQEAWEAALSESRPAESPSESAPITAVTIGNPDLTGKVTTYGNESAEPRKRVQKHCKD